MPPGSPPNTIPPIPTRTSPTTRRSSMSFTRSSGFSPIVPACSPPSPRRKPPRPSSSSFFPTEPSRGLPALGQNVRSLHDDNASISPRNFVEGQADFVGEFLADDQELARRLAEQLMKAVFGEHVAVKQRPHLGVCLARHLHQIGLRMRRHPPGHEQRPKFASLALRNPHRERQHRAA